MSYELGYNLLLEHCQENSFLANKAAVLKSNFVFKFSEKRFVVKTHGRVRLEVQNKKHGIHEIERLSICSAGRTKTLPRQIEQQVARKAYGLMEKSFYKAHKRVSSRRHPISCSQN